MSYLKFFTIAGASPQGKPRVFLACHPDDFSAYREIILRDLFSNNNCAVYYLDPDEQYDTKELLQDLTQMQLFVFAVTQKLLTEPNFAMDKLFSFAEKQHIPVLPLLQEEIDLNDYTKRFGDLQYLGRVAITSTSISYEEQLSKYISSVLIDDELAKKVREAFDAYIFLSYRKKDRYYAQELMRLIHKNDFCRDVAIWYDEFLVPGESFNDAIQEMMQKSDLFALAVTPNLVNEENYVMTTEYPGALKQNKKILAVEMVPTKRRELESKYKAIPECTDPRNAKSLAKALSDALGRISLRDDKDSSSEHLYCIGLAYLNGIDVEVDHERALDLITRASDAGYFAASKKLVSMYENGIGVARNYQKAIDLLKRYIFALDKAYEGIEEIRKSLEYPQTLMDLALLYGSSKNAKEKKNTLNELIGVCHTYSDQRWSGWFEAIALQSIGELEHSQGNYKGAREYLEKSGEKFKKLSEKDNILAVMYARNSLLLGKLCSTNKDIPGAKKYYQEALDCIEKYKDKADFSRVIDSVYLALAETAKTEGEFELAQSYLDKVEEIYKSYRQAGKDVTANVAGLALARCSLRGEVDYRKNLTEAYKDNMVVATDPESTRNEVWALGKKLIELRKNKTMGTVTEEDVEKCRTLLEELKKNASAEEIEDRRKIADVQTILGDENIQLGHFDESVDILKQAYDFYKDYITLNKDVNALAAMAQICFTLAVAEEKRGNMAAATGFREENVTYSSRAVKLRGNPKDYQLLMTAYISLGISYSDMKNKKKAESAFKEAVSIGKKLAKTDRSRRTLELLAQAYTGLSSLNSVITPEKGPLIEKYKIYLELAREYPLDGEIKYEINLIRGNMMRIGISLSKIEKLASKPLKL